MMAKPLSLAAALGLLAAACAPAEPGAAPETAAAPVGAVQATRAPRVTLFQHPYDPNDPVMRPAWRDPKAPASGIKADAAADYQASHPELFAITAPPAHFATIRPMTEHEDMTALVVAYPSHMADSYYDNATATIVQIIRHAAEVAEVWVVTDSSSITGTLEGQVLAAGLAEATLNARVRFFVAPPVAGVPGMTVWFVDYGPMPIIDTLTHTYAFADFRYYPTRPVDDGVPTLLGRHLDDMLGQPGKATTYRAPVSVEGGTLLATTDGTCFTGSRQLVHMGAASDTESLPLPELQTQPQALELRQVWGDYLGCKDVVVLHSITDDGTGHIDMFMKVASDDTIIVGEYVEPFQSGVEATQALNRARLDGNAAFLEARGYTVERIVMPGHASDGAQKVPFTYLNSVLVNGLNLWPAFTFSSWTASRALAQSQWQAAMPGWEHVWIDAEQLSYWSGAIHCITRTIPAATPGLWVDDGVCTGQMCVAPAAGYGGECHPGGTTAEVCWGPEWLCSSNQCGGETCEGFCGGQHPSGCYCDEQCASEGDCCADVCEACSLSCPEPTGCGDVTGAGCCDGSELRYCDNKDELVTQGCGTSGCGWDPSGGSSGWHDCGFSGEDPTHLYPLQCPGTCTPDCAGKSCGTDGCGGTCGACPPPTDMCSTQATCQAGACVPGAPIDCDDGDTCNGAETCDAALGCVPGPPIDCDDGDACTSDACEAGTCVHEAQPDCCPETFSVALGSGGCKPSAYWVALANEACGSPAKVVELALGESCSPGRNAGAAVTCCATADCIDGAVGGPETCGPITYWKALAEQACAVAGMSLDTFVPGATCSWSRSNGASYTCCPAEGCIPGTLGGDGACWPESAWSAAAGEACAALGLTLEAFTLGPRCSRTRYGGASYDCCQP